MFNNFIRTVVRCTGFRRYIAFKSSFEKDDKEKESELIMTLKRAVLCTQWEQYDKAEQMLHIALRLAQQQQNSQGVLYCYDLMANLAMDQHQMEKAEKLFISVMQMLLSAGTPQDDLKIIHISLKLARISHLLAQKEKAEIGYKWCIEQIDKKKDKDNDSRVLYGVVQDWYAQFLLDYGTPQAALVHLKEAYDVCCDVKGYKDEESMLLLNDLGITCWRAGDIEKAEEFLKDAVHTGRTLNDQGHLGVIHANLGLIFMEKGLMSEAEKSCQYASRLGKTHDNKESIQQANYCLEQLKEYYKKKL